MDSIQIMNAQATVFAKVVDIEGDIVRFEIYVNDSLNAELCIKAAISLYIDGIKFYLPEVETTNRYVYCYMRTRDLKQITNIDMNININIKCVILFRLFCSIPRDNSIIPISCITPVEVSHVY